MISPVFSCLEMKKAGVTNMEFDRSFLSEGTSDENMRLSFTVERV